MSEEYMLQGNFEFENEAERFALLKDYVDAIKYFDQLYMWTKEVCKKHSITISEFDQIEETLEVGRTALLKSAELSAHSVSNYDTKPRDNLIKRVNEVLQIRRAFMNDPKKQLVLGYEFLQ